MVEEVQMVIFSITTLGQPMKTIKLITQETSMQRPKGMLEKLRHCYQVITMNDHGRSIIGVRVLSEGVNRRWWNQHVQD